jgi:hypothetical protein
MSETIGTQLTEALERAINAEHRAARLEAELDFMRDRAERAEAKLMRSYAEPDSPEVLELRNEETELEAKRQQQLTRKDELERQMTIIRMRIRTTGRLPPVEYSNLCARQAALGEEMEKAHGKIGENNLERKKIHIRMDELRAQSRLTAPIPVAH